MEQDSETELAQGRITALQDAEDLIDRLHAEAETHRATLGRTIHDDLGGLMVSAAMDLTSVRQRLHDVDPATINLLDRSKKTLESAIDVSRKLVEELRPSILDNFGLFAALKWQLKRASQGSSAQLTESYPSTEPAFQPAAVTALFRVAQEAIAMIFRRTEVAAVGITFAVEEGGISMKFTDDGVPHVEAGQEVGALGSLTSMKHRIRALGGTVELIRADSGGTVLTAYMPMPEDSPR